jgi:tetratricopeptide (TPR) repeat protein
VVTASTDYQTDLERIEKDIADLRDHALVPPTDTEKVTKYVHSVYQHAVHTGNLTQLEAAEPVIDEGIRQIRFPGDLYFLKANLAFKLHRLDDVRRNLEADPSLLTGPEGQAVQADLDFQQGRYQQARKGYESVIASNRSWDNLARLAHYQAKMGDTAGADRLFSEAEDELTAKEMRSYAWVELQRGLLDLAHGRHDEADEHYERAERAYSGHWLTAEHKAELLGAQGRYGDAAARYQDIVECVPKPEIQQAFGELLTVMGEHERAQIWLTKAHAGYLDAAQRGGVHYYHHLVDFYADVRKDGAEAVKWARKDIALRNNFSSQAALAWALYRNGQFAEALDRINQALASGAASAHLFAQAAAIHRAAGQPEDATRYAQAAAAINPRHHSFHVHR